MKHAANKQQINDFCRIYPKEWLLSFARKECTFHGSFSNVVVKKSRNMSSMPTIEWFDMEKGGSRVRQLTK